MRGARGLAVGEAKQTGESESKRRLRKVDATSLSRASVWQTLLRCAAGAILTAPVQYQVVPFKFEALWRQRLH